eukprot:3275329-Amphidinium_carterae.1
MNNSTTSKVLFNNSASIDGVVASQQPSLRPGDKVPAGTDLITITEMAAVTAPSPSGTQATLHAGDILPTNLASFGPE